MIKYSHVGFLFAEERTLLKCQECGYPVVSTEAKSCPKCGAPIASEEIATSLVTVQRTSKSLKTQEWLATVILIVGFAFLAFNDFNNRIGWLMTLIGAGWAFITRIRIWLHHD
jgi:RNA polymerase subunit RPABC4/transcription elongation factor Spt4